MPWLAIERPQGGISPWLLVMQIGWGRMATIDCTQSVGLSWSRSIPGRLRTRSRLSTERG
jgi:hypothetical protein